MISSIKYLLCSEKRKTSALTGILAVSFARVIWAFGRFFFFFPGVNLFLWSFTSFGQDEGASIGVVFLIRRIFHR